MTRIAGEMSQLVQSLVQEKNAIYITKDANQIEALRVMAYLAV